MKKIENWTTKDDGVAIPLDCIIKWKKLHPAAKIPTKRDEDAGFDIYTIEDDIILAPHACYMFKTGIAAAVSPGYWLMGFDRGSTGSRGIHLHCGVVDNGYRGEIFVCLSNTNDHAVKFTSEVDEISWRDVDGKGYNFAAKESISLDKILLYPTSKAIVQLIPVKQPTVYSQEATDEEWETLSQTERGAGKLGSSKK